MNPLCHKELFCGFFLTTLWVIPTGTLPEVKIPPAEHFTALYLLFLVLHPGRLLLMKSAHSACQYYLQDDNNLLVIVLMTQGTCALPF